MGVESDDANSSGGVLGRGGVGGGILLFPEVEKVTRVDFLVMGAVWVGFVYGGFFTSDVRVRLGFLILFTSSFVCGSLVL
jgi:hypothetical protein